jgi:hypothetical protein
MGVTLLRMCASRPLADLHVEAWETKDAKSFKQKRGVFYMRKAAGNWWPRAVADDAAVLH